MWIGSDTTSLGSDTLRFIFLFWFLVPQFIHNQLRKQRFFSSSFTLDCYIEHSGILYKRKTNRFFFGTTVRLYCRSNNLHVLVNKDVVHPSQAKLP